MRNVLAIVFAPLLLLVIVFAAFLRVPPRKESP